MSSTSNRQWRLAARPVGTIGEANFTWHAEPLPELEDGQVRVRNIYLSLDPTNRIWAATDSYLPAVGIGDVMRGGAVGVVEESKNPAMAVGTVVMGLTGWQDYYTGGIDGLSAVHRIPGQSLTIYHGLFGAIGMTAFFGLLDIAKPKEGETLVVSAAAGAVGSLVGQIGKIKGCHVVGIAGGPDKCKWITEELGFDAAIDYKSENVAAKLKEYCPKGIDVYFDNVGGKILDAVLGQINDYARISVCGLISQYNATEPVPGPYNFANVLVRRARIEGFIVLDYFNRAPEAFAELGKWLAEGKLKYRVDVVDGLENTPRALEKLFDGSNTGKLVVKISEE
jgi:NADPH-dependent curcumin reductase